MKRILLSIMLVICMAFMLVPQAVFADSETSSAPSVNAYATYATRTQLMDGTFTPDSDDPEEDNYGKAEKYGKIVFGKNESGNPQEWYVLGGDNKITNSEGAFIDNTILFAASPIATNQRFDSSNTNSSKNYDLAWKCKYSNYTMTEKNTVSPNHYGGSELRKTLQDMVEEGNTTYFTETEKELMNSTTVTTRDEYKRPPDSQCYDYTTTDKLYALAKGDGLNASENKIIKAGTSD